MSRCFHLVECIYNFDYQFNHYDSTRGDPKFSYNGRSPDNHHRSWQNRDISSKSDLKLIDYDHSTIDNVNDYLAGCVYYFDNIFNFPR